MRMYVCGTKRNFAAVKTAQIAQIKNREVYPATMLSHVCQFGLFSASNFIKFLQDR